MANIDIRRQLVDRLNKACHTALSEASNVCVGAGHREVVIEHLLVSLCEQNSNDIRLIFRNLNLDFDKLSDELRSCFNRFRVSNGEMPSLSPLIFDLLEAAWLITSLELNEQKIRGGAILLALVRDPARYCRYEYIDILEKVSPITLMNRFFSLTSGSVEQIFSNDNDRSTKAEKTAVSESALEKYAENFTQQAREGKIDPVFCRDNEIRQIIDILARRRKNNPICVGDAGVGKTAVVEGLAYKIVNNDVPESLQGAEIYGLDMGALEAGASVKGEFEKRLKAVLDELKNADKQTVLFIDEAHTLIGAGGNAGGSDAANLLKPALARGEIKTIAATTWSEYKKYFEKDPALTRRFQLVKLDEPSVEQASIIIRGLVPAYEKAHEGIYISDAGVEAAARLSSRYITGRQLPDKAIDVLDTACARVKAGATGMPLQIEKYIQEAKALEREKDSIERDIAAGHHDKALQERIDLIHDKLVHINIEKERLTEILGEQRTLINELKTLRDEKLAEQTDDEKAILQEKIVLARQRFEDARREYALVSLEVGPQEIAAVISDWTGIPVSSMAQDEIDSLLNLKNNIANVIKGQDYSLQIIQEQLQASRLDLHKSGRPLGVFLLVGPSGVGKTETAIEVARKLFGGEQFMTTINMTEFQEKHTVSRLIGSPPGYVGYGEGGILTEAIRKKPYSVVLLDEVEKADADVLNIFYQVFDKGILSDGEGREIDCKNVVFFLASNLASHSITESALNSPEKTSDDILNEIKPALTKHFKPALLARMQPTVYMPLSKEVMRDIIEAKLTQLADMFIERQGLIFEISSRAIEHLESLCNEAASGARLIDQLIQKRILPEISRTILESRLTEKNLISVLVDINEDGSYNFTFAAQPEEINEAAQ